jgi:A/G-specific adenine glycosylase
VQAAADALVPAGAGWVWNQALMDLGAVVCRPVPSCAECPLATLCGYRGVGSDPAVGSAAVSVRQAPYEGSDRQARGRLLAALGRAPLTTAEVAEVMRRTPVAAALLVDGLVAEGLVTRVGTTLRLP